MFKREPPEGRKISRQNDEGGSIFFGVQGEVRCWLEHVFLLRMKIHFKENCSSALFGKPLRCVLLAGRKGEESNIVYPDHLTDY